MKNEAYTFLKELQVQLNTKIGAAQEVRGRVREMQSLAREDPAFRFYYGAEDAFTKGIALPALYHELTTTFQYSKEQARTALYAEGFKNLPKMAVNTPARVARHPFSKTLVGKPQDIYAQWIGRKSGMALKQSCPDFALRKPFAHNIVFEAKYFIGKTPAAAERELVGTAYQSFFYRGLPENLTNPRRPWGYDYAVAFVFDASSEGFFESAWNSLPSSVKEGFWGGANVYVMILGGRQLEGCAE